MVSVLVIGANGYIGTPTALQLKQRGHTVYGLVRDASKGVELEKNGINVVVGDVTKVDSLLIKYSIVEIVKKVDVIINSTMDFTNPSLDKVAFENISAAIEKAGGDKKKKFIFVSGCLVSQPSQSKITEDSPYISEEYVKELEQGFPIFGMLLPNRIEIEKRVLASKLFNGVVVRPPKIYGGAKGSATIFFTNAEEGKLIVYGEEDGIVAVIHVDDVASGLVKVVESDDSKVAGQIFQLSEDGHTNNEVAYALAKGTGKEVEKLEKSKEAIPIPLLFSKGNLDIDSTKARTVLGWAPTHNLIRDSANFYTSWKSLGVPARW